MVRIERQFTAAILGILMVAIAVAQAPAQTGLKTINPPGGGMIVYGQVDGQTTEAGAMGAILRHIHDSMGEKPQVGKLFEVKGSQSVAVFFTVKRHSGDGGQSAGMIIATKSSSDRVEAALLSDDAPKFSKSLGPMMKTLFSQWHPLQRLVQAVLPDNSASAGLPDGWKIVQGSGGGTITATGPNGEIAWLGMAFNAEDTNNPQVQQLMRTLQSGGLRNSVYATAFYYPYGRDAKNTFVDTLQFSRHKIGKPPAKYDVTSVTPAPSNNPQLRCAHLGGTVNFTDDNVGDREFTAVFCISAPNNFGMWSSYMTAVLAPVAIAPKERATMAAIMASFNVNQGVVSAQAAAIAAPAIQAIKAIGEQTAIRVKAAHEIEDIHNSSVYQRWDSMDRRSQEFSNYQLGYSVIQDNDKNTHGTVWNDDANLLVKTDPNRFEYVNAPNYWNGIDY